MVIILKANNVNLFVSSVLFVFWYHSLNFLDTPLTSQVYDHAVVEFMRFCHRTVSWPEFGHLYLLFLSNSLGKDVHFPLFLKACLV
jgi:hypothetical protein